MLQDFLSNIDNSRSFPNMQTDILIHGSKFDIVNAGWKCQPHIHHGMLEINLVLNGSQLSTVNAFTFTQTRGDILLIPPMHLHKYSIGNNSPLVFFVFHLRVNNTKLIELMNATKQVFFPKGHEINDKIRPLIEQLSTSLLKEATSITIFSILFEILKILEIFYESISVDSIGHSDDAISDKIVHSIENLLVNCREHEQVLPANWMEQTSKALEVSRRHCCRVFQNKYNMSPRRYLSILRQQEAMQLLICTKNSIEKISYKLGFENVQSFTRQFTKWTGTPPSKFRHLQPDSISYLTPLELREDS